MPVTYPCRDCDSLISAAILCDSCAEDAYKIECDLCGEDVPQDEQEGGTCLDCCEREHQRQERYR